MVMAFLQQQRGFRLIGIILGLGRAKCSEQSYHFRKYIVLELSALIRATRWVIRKIKFVRIVRVFKISSQSGLFRSMGYLAQ